MINFFAVLFMECKCAAGICLISRDAMILFEDLIRGFRKTRSKNIDWIRDNHSVIKV